MIEVMMMMTMNIGSYSTVKVAPLLYSTVQYSTVLYNVRVP
jgi:hypothetical protein